MGIGTAINTHAMYGTIGHQHLDALVYWATGDFPDAGLNLVECRDGRWFVEVDHGDRYNSMEGISKPNLSPYVQPQFFLRSRMHVNLQSAASSRLIQKRQ
ncbi:MULTISPECIES: hypothetical protein [Herbaspirillum]|uniref:Uncharacterized protein n=2 Tax=Herbaspirillum huttiense TaxID=863372 RepID=A0AAJ2HDT6_9BURK|nr:MULTISPECIES: hypothetical protein [Herbaspirillum]MDR9836925.1 hypothetical protein [Herbaspirillum huttiense]